MVTKMEKRTWREFKDSKLLWWVNRSLHLFGWAIVIETDTEENVVCCYPARVPYRGFPEADEEAGFEGLTQYMLDEAQTLWSEVNAEAPVEPSTETTPDGALYTAGHWVGDIAGDWISENSAVYEMGLATFDKLVLRSTDSDHGEKRLITLRQDGSGGNCWYMEVTHEKPGTNP